VISAHRAKGDRSVKVRALERVWDVIGGERVAMGVDQHVDSRRRGRRRALARLD
jgi:hypothetical protein